MKLLSGHDQRCIDSHLVARLDELLGGREVPALGQAMRDYVLAGGKRIRPQLVAWTWRHARGDRSGELPTTILDLAVAWEIFHAFLLVHDDIIDGADSRRDQPALHRQLAALDSHCPRFGTNLGIVAGDLLFTAAMKLWHSLDLPMDLFRAELRLFARIAELTGYGQAIDIVQGHVPLDHVEEATLLREYHWKTAAYTFDGPMLSGAIAAGLDERAQAAISRFALGIGQAYQLQNDLLDLAGPCHEGSDLVQGKRTVTIIRHRAALSPAERVQLDGRIEAITSGNGHALELAEQFRRDLLETPALAKTRELVDELLAQADAAASDDSLDEPMRAGLHDLLARLRSSYFATV